MNNIKSSLSEQGDGATRHLDYGSLPLAIYSSPGSRWVDPALGCQWPTNLPPLFEVSWRIGDGEIHCVDPGLDSHQNGALLRSLLRVLAVYIASLHGGSCGAVRYHYYHKKEEPGFVKIDANSDFIAVGFDLSLRSAEEIFREFHRVRLIQRIVNSKPLESISFVPIVLFGAEGDLVFYVESMYGVPAANAYFNSRSLEFWRTFARILENLRKNRTRTGATSRRSKPGFRCLC